MKPLQVDAHTHTIASGHAYGTINEMAQAAAEKGIRLLGLTEHTSGIPGTCADIYFANLRIMPRQLHGVDLLLGAELNIVDYEGTVDLEEYLLKGLDIRIASIHDLCYTYGTKEQNTAALVGAISNPYVDLIGHPDDGNCPVDYETVVRAAAEHHTLLEINNNALRSPRRKDVFQNCCTILKLCRKYDTPVACDSDAHFMHDIANMDHVSRVFEAVDFPEELVLNYSARRFREFLQENRAECKPDGAGGTSPPGRGQKAPEKENLQKNLATFPRQV